MQYEVELKYLLPDSQIVISQIRELGAVAQATVDHVDHYFNHPSRDFRVTNEAFRIRRVGTDNGLTYKGPVLDTTTKMRREIEIPFATGTDVAEQMSALLTELGFRSIREVRKTRTPWSLDWNDHHYELALDHVPSIGDFLEIELLASEAERDQARDAILKLADHLKLPPPERRSYLELVLANDATTKCNG